jgi:membrane associated rhomboid family serine protease
MIPSTVSLICISIIIGAIAIARMKKLMITYALLIANFIVFIISYIYPYITNTSPIVIRELGFRPIYLSFEQLPQLYTLFTSMFLHGDFFHILGNMIVFLFMGIAFEQRIGWKNFLAIYLITGVCGALAHSFVNLGSDILLIGASGAIFGILGAFAYSYPRDEVVMPIPLGIIMIFRRIKVMYAAVLFAVMETVIVVLGASDNTAHFAHLGGLLSGVVIAALIIGKQGEKTKQHAATAVYSDPSLVPKKKKINFSTLRKLAITPELRETLSRIENETVLQVRDIWLEHFLEKTTCPICSKPLSHSSRKIWCEDDHIKMEY